MPEKALEYLVINGYLDRAGRFTPRRCRSTPNVREWPVIEESDVVAELLDADGGVLHRELAQVRPDIDCDPGDAKRWSVLVYIGLRPEAAAVRLRRDDVVLWTAEIPPAASLRVITPRGRPDRRKRYVLGLRYSEPGEGAHVTVVYKWGERRFRSIYIGPPAEKLELDLREVPGGDKCRFVVDYSNGLRSAADATREFDLPPLGPSLVIARPARGDRALADTPILLEGHVDDPERPGGARPDEHLVWVVDDEEVGRGPSWSVDGLGAGRHRVTLRYETESKEPFESSVDVRVVASKAPPADSWEDWDPTDDRFQ
jgi:hypothetical protein